MEYVQANWALYMFMEEYSKLFSKIDLFLGSALGQTNPITPPEISIPHSFGSKGQPTSLSITGKPFGEGEILLIANAFQARTDFHHRHPKL
jgi:hypothetical protein